MEDINTMPFEQVIYPNGGCNDPEIFEDELLVIKTEEAPKDIYIAPLFCEIKADEDKNKTVTTLAQGR